MKQDLQANKTNAIEFYRMAYLGEPALAVEKYVGADYVQHNPAVGNGKQPFIDYFEEMARDYPGKTIEFVRAVAEGDLVALHTHQAWPGLLGHTLLAALKQNAPSIQIGGRYPDRRMV